MTVEDTPVQARPDASANPQLAFRDLLADFQTGLERELHRWLGEKQRELTAEVEAAGELTSRLDQYVLRGGKRLRPALLFYSYRACGGRSQEQVMPAALSVEFLHTYLLIHDDIMDRAPTRRGEPTAHLVFRDEHVARGWKGDPDHHGESTAILLGDLAHCFAEELFRQVPVDPSSAADLHRCFSTMCQEVITGQYLEFTAGNRERLTEEDLLQVLRMKSGRYSVERPIQLGALLAGASESTLEGLSRFGLLLGEAFQLHDDLLGMFGDSATVGKPVGGDLIEGKFTILVHHALTHASEEDARRLRGSLGDSGLEQSQVEEITEIIRQTGAERRVTEMVESRHLEAARVLSELDLEPRGKSFLAGLVDYLRERNL